MSDMATAPAYVPHRIDIDEYHRMVAAGVFDPDARIELIDGTLIERVAPMYPPHAGTVTTVSRIFSGAFSGRADVRNQVPLTLGSASEPQPDIVLAKLDAANYTRRHPNVADLYLVVEVCDSTRDADQREKVPLYAREGVPEVWLVDLVDDCLRTYREPSAGVYRAVARLERGEMVSTLAFDAIGFAVSDLLPP